MSILDALFGRQNNGQQAQVPGAMQQPGFLSPEVAMPIAGALMGSDGNMANFGKALSTYGMQAAQTGRQNKTLSFLRKNSPELAGAVDAGMPINEAWQTYTQQRFAQKSKNIVNAGDGRLYNADSGEWITAPGAGGDYSKREQAAEQFGLKPDDPAYRSYVLTGKMPREDQAPLTATDKKAILEADEMVQVTDTAMPLLDRALELNDQAYSGPMAGTRGYISGTFGSDAGQATMEYDNLVQQQALATLKATFGAAPTEGERKILLEIAGSSSQPPEVRKGILERAKQAVTRRQQFYQERAQEMRGGSFYKPGGGATGQGGQPSADGWADVGNGVRIRRTK